MTMKLTWISDPHLNFFRDGTGAIESFLRGKDLGDGILITGDISEHPKLVYDLSRFMLVVGKNIPVFFVLGNHDFYRGGFARTRVMMVRDETLRSISNLHYLTDSPPVDLGNGVYLTGHDGLYDCRAGFAEESNLIMSDFMLIAELAAHYRTATHMKLIEVVREIADRFAREAKVKLEAAVAKGAKKVLFGTHYPPFTGACWHQGAISDGDWLPWFTSLAMGKVLSDVAFENPDIAFEVFCGHTHSNGVYNHLPNLVVYTAKANYGSILTSTINVTPVLWARVVVTINT